MEVLLNQITVTSNKEKNLEKILKIIDNYEADLMIFPEYIMGVPDINLTYEYVSTE